MRYPSVFASPSRALGPTPYLPNVNPQVVSLVPAATDMLLAIGGQHLLVGCSHDCHLPASGSIPRFSDTDLPSITPLQPDVLLVAPRHHALLSSLLPAATILCVDPRSVESMLDATLQVGEVTHLQASARHVVVSMRNRMFDAAEWVNPYVEPPVVGFLSSFNPPHVAGEWIVQVIERAGGSHPWNPTVAREGAGDASGPQHGERVAPPSFQLTPRQWLAHPAQLVVIASQPNQDLQLLPDWLTLTPVAQRGRIVHVPATRFRPGPGLVDTFIWLVATINDRPDLLPPGLPTPRRSQ
jgi:ABC-type Fe3+-hydroxamate transport system substrate-binding protein